MKTNKLNELERSLDDAAAGEKPLLAVFQDLDDPDLFLAHRGTQDEKEYKREDLDDLRKQYEVLTVTYGDWPPGGKE